MAENPYQPPPAVTECRVLWTEAPRRPVGLTFVTGLQFLFAAVIVMRLATLLIEPRSAFVQAHALGVSVAMLMAMYLLSVLLNVAAAIGLCIPKPWGWWLSAYCYLDGIIRGTINVGSLLSPGGDVSEILITATFLGCVVSGSLLFYLFKPHVVAYFRLEKLNRPLALVKLSGLVLALIVVCKWSS